MFAEFALSLALTLIFEGLAGIIAGLRGKNMLLLALANVLTNPVAVLLHALYPFAAVTAALELSAVIVEGALYSRLGEKIAHPWAFSLAANAFSFLCGNIINIFI